MNWTGLYAGGHIGGGWSNDHWSDTFGSAPSGLGATNIAGFGDTTHATGPLAGGQVGFDLQKANAVFGVQADASALNMVGRAPASRASAASTASAPSARWAPSPAAPVMHGDGRWPMPRPAAP